ncbi:hypothetical protein LPB140_10070 [Sphingorhabdus lutea]|uniref:Crp/Fnr family transcriptional regulator n=1 Tax=Sphingorhabdus lutea TaxID=1913578 RepID=A0A1L3JD67_9SPHN|nr:Crp/Fnr family transcriptional regulator [Sphingorhabdus lutea]APG63074.1 hypothetical protein LPB140_10070 [Sphingorhabdus lutea]
MLNNLQSPTKYGFMGNNADFPSLISSLPIEVVDKILSDARLKKYKGGESLAITGDDVDSIWLIKKGRVKLGQHDQDGKFHLIIIMGQGDSFGELATLGGFTRVVDALVMGETEIYKIDARKFNNIVHSDIKILSMVTAILSKQFQILVDTFIKERHRSASWRLSYNLYSMCRGLEMPVHIPVTQQELGELLGLSRVTISGLLEKMEKSNLVKREYGGVTVLNRNGLLDF